MYNNVCKAKRWAIDLSIKLEDRGNDIDYEFINDVDDNKWTNDFDDATENLLFGQTGSQKQKG